MMNKKAKAGSGMIYMIIIGIVALIFFLSGGIKTIAGISGTISQIPSYVWIIFLMFIIILILRRK